MAPSHVYTPEDLASFDVLTSLVWIVDFERGGRCWVNLACLPLWNVTSREELLARPIEPPSETTRTRLEALRRRFERGQRSIDRWTIYPDGAPPFFVECKSSGILFAPARGAPAKLCMLIEGRLLGPDEQDPLERRSVEALRYLGELVSFHDESGAPLMRNPAAVRAFGDAEGGARFADDFVDPAQAAEARACLAARRPFRADTCVRTRDGDRWFDTEARPVLDPVTGNPAILVNQRDIAERRAHVQALEHSGRRLAEQAEALRLLAAPVIRVGDGVLALPLIGKLERERIDVALAALLAHTARERAHRVVLDLTGAEVIDATVGADLLRIVRVLQLQGITAVFSGLRPELARAIVVAGLDLSGVPCFQSLAHALRG